MSRATNAVWVTLALVGCGDSPASDENAAEPAVATRPLAVTPPTSEKVEQALAAIVATCSKCDGTVEVRRKGKPYWEPIAVGGLFRDGDWIRTGAKASARIRFVSGGHLDLDATTTLLVEATVAKGDGGRPAGVRVAVQSGGASGVLDGRSDAPIMIRTKEGEVQIGAAKGKPSAEFRLKPGENGSVEVAVSKGELVVRSDTSESRLDAGTGDKLKAKFKPRLASDAIGFPISTSPKIDARFPCSKELKIDLVWAPLTGATGYRVVVARDLSFGTIVSSNDVKQTHSRLTLSAPGQYVWRVAAKDVRGKYGEFGFARRLFCDKSSWDPNGLFPK